MDLTTFRAHKCLSQTRGLIYFSFLYNCLSVTSTVLLFFNIMNSMVLQKKKSRNAKTFFYDVIGNIADLNLVSRKNVRHHTRKALLKKFNVVFSENNQLHRRGLLNFSQFSSTKAKATRAFIFKKTNKKGYKAIL